MSEKVMDIKDRPNGGVNHLTLFGYYAQFRPSVPYPQSQNTLNHAVFEGSAVYVTDMFR